MLYSVWNYGAARYDYYQTSSPSSTTHAGTPPKRFGVSPLGATPEQVAWDLPPDAVYAGSGAIAKGRIATRASGILGGLLGMSGFDADQIPTYIVYAGIAYAAWRVLR